MATSYAHHIVCNGSAASVFAALDFGTAGVLDGPPAAVGTSRTIDMGKVKIVEMMTAREVTPLKHSYTYVITNDDNPFAVSARRCSLGAAPPRLVSALLRSTDSLRFLFDF
jgi:hypothetical protein